MCEALDKLDENEYVSEVSKLIFHSIDKDENDEIEVDKL